MSHLELTRHPAGGNGSVRRIPGHLAQITACLVRVCIDRTHYADIRPLCGQTGDARPDGPDAVVDGAIG